MGLRPIDRNGSSGDQHDNRARICGKHGRNQIALRARKAPIGTIHFLAQNALAGSDDNNRDVGFRGKSYRRVDGRLILGFRDRTAWLVRDGAPAVASNFGVDTR